MRAAYPVCLILGLFAAPATAVADDPVSFLMGGAVSVPEITGAAVFASAGTIESARVRVENLIVAGGTISLNDVIAENLMAAGGTVTVNATGVENARLAGGTVNFSGNTSEDLGIGAGMATVAAGSKIGGDLTLQSGKADFSGTVGGDARIEAEVIAIAGGFGGDVVLNGRQVTIAPGTKIGGNLSLPRAATFTMPEGVTVAGAIQFGGSAKIPGDNIKATVENEVKKSIANARRTERGDSSDIDSSDAGGLGMTGWLTMMLTLAACGALALAVAPQFVARAAQQLTQAPLESLLIGAASMVAVPLLLVVIGVTVIGIPFAVLGAAAYAIGIGLGLIALCLWGGLMVRTIANQPGEETRLAKLVGWTLMGFLVLALIGAVPWIGRWVQVLAVTAGAGAVLATAWHARRQKTAAAI